MLFRLNKVFYNNIICFKKNYNSILFKKNDYVKNIKKIKAFLQKF